ncbi:MAG TPA: hypothetical protein PK718_04790, partial [Candidatus Methanofastidiosa archaeon]|nr:hypothetical protein [Candidatus Methanofastidiosa archaeon]
MLSDEQKWEIIDNISGKTVTYGEYRTTIKDAVAEITVKPLTGIPIAMAVLYGFWSFFGAVAGFFTDGFFVKLFGGSETFIGIIPWLGEQLSNHQSSLFKIFIGDPNVFLPDYAGDI